MDRSHLRWPEKVRNALGRFRVRLVLVVLIAVLPGLGFILYSAAAERRQELEHARESAARLTQLAAANHESLIEETRQLLRILVRVPAVSGSDPAACRTFLLDVTKESAPRYTGFTVVDRNGLIICASVPGADSANVSSRSFFRRAIETRGFAIGDYLLGRFTGEPLLVMAYPLLDREGQVERVVTAALNLGWLNEFAARAQLPPEATLTLLDHKGTILVRYPHPEQWVGRSVRDTPLFAAIRRSGKGIASAEGVDDVPRLFEFTQLVSRPPDGELYLVVGLAQSELYADSNRALRISLVMLGVLTILALLAAWVGGDLFFLRQVNALMRATKRIEGGDLSARTGLRPGRGELDRLAQTFDRTAASLEERTDALQRLNRVYAVLSGIEGVLLRHPEREELLQSAADIAVDEGKFRLAVIHELDPRTGELRVACQAGVSAEEARQVARPSKAERPMRTT